MVTCPYCKTEVKLPSFVCQDVLESSSNVVWRSPCCGGGLLVQPVTMILVSVINDKDFVEDRYGDVITHRSATDYSVQAVSEKDCQP